MGTFLPQFNLGSVTVLEAVYSQWRTIHGFGLKQRKMPRRGVAWAHGSCTLPRLPFGVTLDVHYWRSGRSYRESQVHASHSNPQRTVLVTISIWSGREPRMGIVHISRYSTPGTSFLSIRFRITRTRHLSFWMTTKRIYGHPEY